MDTLVKELEIDAQFINEMGNNNAIQLLKTAKENQRPLYLGYEDYSIEYWADVNAMFVKVTPDVAQKLGLDLGDIKKKILNG